MILWSTIVHTLRPMASLPRLRMVAEEAVDSAAYRHFGRYRQSETHCIFKYTLRGSGVFRDGSGEYRMGAGQGFLVEIRDPQTAYYYPPDAGEPWQFFYAAFDHPNATAMVRDMTVRYGPVYGLPPTHPALERLMGLRGREPRRQATLSPFRGAEAVWQLLCALAATREPAPGENALPLLIRRARQAVAEDRAGTLNVSELANRLQVSREHLSRRFRVETGMAPHAYIVRERMVRACRMLKETDLSLKEIAVRLGYGEPGHFTRTFRGALGMTPRRFRERGSIPTI